MATKNNVVLISTFIIFVFEAIVTFMVGKMSNQTDTKMSLPNLLPSPKDLLKIIIVVGTFSMINHIVVKNLS